MKPGRESSLSNRVPVLFPTDELYNSAVSFFWPRWGPVDENFVDRRAGHHCSCLPVELPQDRDVDHQIHWLDVLDARRTTEMVGSLLAIALSWPEHDTPLAQFADQEPLEPSPAIVAIAKLLFELLRRLRDALAGSVFDF